MEDLRVRKTLLFLLLTAIGSLFSFAIRNILVLNYDKWDFKLISIDYIKNYGAAFSLFHTHTVFLVVISTIILLIVIAYIIKNIKSFTSTEIIFSSLLTSGILCNLVERLIDGYVTDYIRLNFVTFPIFNISDLFINMGAFILICNILFSDESKDN